MRSLTTGMMSDQSMDCSVRPKNGVIQPLGTTKLLSFNADIAIKPITMAQSHKRMWTSAVHTRSPSPIKERYSIASKTINKNKVHSLIRIEILILKLANFRLD